MPDGMIEPGIGAKKLLPAWHAHERHLWEHLPYVTTRDDAILLRDGDLMGSVLVDGLNAELSEETAVEGARRVLTSLVNAAGEDVAWYIHRISVPIARPRPHRPAQSFRAEIDRRDRITERDFEAIEALYGR